MPILHICNTNFEWELSQESPPPLAHAFDQHPVFLQLQFLPFLYANPEDSVLVTCTPPADFGKQLEKFNIAPPKMHHILSESFSAYDHIDSWGYSRKILDWAKEKKIPYSMPSWDIIKTINSKVFSFQACPLPGGKLLYHEEDLRQWIKTQKREAVLKTPFGSSGRGHYFIQVEQEIDWRAVLAFANKEWKEKRAVIGEPWVKRHLDFSTQWEISKEKKITKLGVTLCVNDLKGRHQSNEVGDLSLFFGNHLEKIKEHEQFVEKVLLKIMDLGYFGNVGIDAMIYEKEDRSFHLHPIVEINARKTMGWTALEIRRKHFPEKQFRLSYVKSDEAKDPFLPSYVIDPNGSKVRFTKQLIIRG